VEPAPSSGLVRLIRLNGELAGARVLPSGEIEFSYCSAAAAIAVLDRAPKLMKIDGAKCTMKMAGPNTVLLPRGEHIVTITPE
jgi:hypothetical protein